MEKETPPLRWEELQSHTAKGMNIGMYKQLVLLFNLSHLTKKWGQLGRSLHTEEWASRIPCPHSALRMLAFNLIPPKRCNILLQRLKERRTKTRTFWGLPPPMRNLIYSLNLLWITMSIYLFIVSQLWMDNLGSPDIWRNLLTQKAETNKQQPKKSRGRRDSVEGEEENLKTC